MGPFCAGYPSGDEQSLVQLDVTEYVAEAVDPGKKLEFLHYRIPRERVNQLILVLSSGLNPHPPVSIQFLDPTWITAVEHLD
jgi:hypothetical protein